MLKLSCITRINTIVKALDRPVNRNSFPLTASFFRLYSSESPSILQQIKNDMKQAMREKQKTKLAVIKSIISDIGYAEKSVQPFIVIKNDEDVAPLLQKAIKKRQDSISQYKLGGREDLVEAETQEISILQSYLPKPYTEEEIEAELKKVIQEVKAESLKDLGKVLKSVTLDPAKAPKSTIALLAKKLLSLNKQ